MQVEASSQPDLTRVPAEIGTLVRGAQP
jgi:hypothetical protein